MGKLFILQLSYETQPLALYTRGPQTRCVWW